MSELQTFSPLCPGDVITVKRYPVPYWHFAVYIGGGRVIQFAGPESDFGHFSIQDVCVQEAPFSNFLRDADRFYVLEFSKKHRRPHRRTVFADTPGMLDDPIMPIYAGNLPLCDKGCYHVFTPVETVARARFVAENCRCAAGGKGGHMSWTGFDGRHYDLAFNNCEHFALWCHTNISESHQVQDVLRTVGIMIIGAIGVAVGLSKRSPGGKDDRQI